MRVGIEFQIITRWKPRSATYKRTPSLDTETERLVQEALERLSEGRTTIAIAHRLSTVRDADQIVVLNDGRVAEIGTYDELIAAGGKFAELVAGDRPLEAELARIVPRGPIIATDLDARELRIRTQQLTALDCWEAQRARLDLSIERVGDLFEKR